MSKRAQRPDVEPGDEVYVRHPQHGPMAVKVLAHGKDGMTGRCDRGKPHRLPWASYLGHKTRMTQRMRIIDQGADGALLEDDKGRRRFVTGGLPDPNDAPAPPAAPERDDPLLGGLDRFHKSMTNEATMHPDTRILFLKAGPIAQRAGLALKDVTDKAGHQTKRWTRSGTAEPANDKSPAPMQHGDVVQFRHGDVQGQGKIVASGADGVTVQDHAGREHQVRHEHLVHPSNDDGAPPEQGGKAQPAQQERDAATGGGSGGDGTGDNPPPLFSDAEVQALPAKANQPTADKDELYAKSNEALAHLESWLNKGKGLCDQLGYETVKGGMGKVDWDKPGGLLFIAPLKGQDRAGEKVAADYGGDWSQLRDVVRCSIAVDSHDDLKSTLEALKKGGLQLAMRPKDRFNKPTDVGYRDLLMNVKFPNGVIGEVQLHLKSMLKAKKEGHKPYETMRTIDAKDRDEWTPEDEKAWTDAFKESVAIYGKAWSAGGSGGGDLKKAMGMDGAWEYFEHEGATFRRPAGKPGGVTHILQGGSWAPYKGDRTAPVMYGDRTMMKGGEAAAEQDSEGALAKALASGQPVLFLKGR